MIRWSPEAAERLEALEAHVAKDNRVAAARLIGRITPTSNARRCVRHRPSAALPAARRWQIDRDSLAGRCF